MKWGEGTRERNGRGGVYGMRGNRGSGSVGGGRGAEDLANLGQKATATFWAVAGEAARSRACRGGSDLRAR